MPKIADIVIDSTQGDKFMAKKKTTAKAVAKTDAKKHKLGLII